MAFSARQREMIDLQYKNTSARIAEILADLTTIPFTAESHPHVWKRFGALAAMTSEELMAEIEADYALFSWFEDDVLLR